MRDTESKDSTRERISEVSKMSLGSDQLSTTEVNMASKPINSAGSEPVVRHTKILFIAL